MYENLLVELPLAEFFLSKLVSRHSDVSIHHLASLDPVMYKNLLFLKSDEDDVADLGLDFTVVVDELGETKVVRKSTYRNYCSLISPASCSTTVHFCELLFVSCS
mgnify:CR=1 FL=1